MEILICKSCRQEYEYYYSFHNEQEIVSQTNCGCVKQSHNIKPLDLAFIKINEFLND